MTTADTGTLRASLPNADDGVPDPLLERFHAAGIYTDDEVWTRVNEIMSSMLGLSRVDVVPMPSGHRYRRTSEGWERA